MFGVAYRRRLVAARAALGTASAGRVVNLSLPLDLPSSGAAQPGQAPQVITVVIDPQGRLVLRRDHRSGRRRRAARLGRADLWQA